jgi:hypothetical protein
MVIQKVVGAYKEKLRQKSIQNMATPKDKNGHEYMEYGQI